MYLGTDLHSWYQFMETTAISRRQEPHFSTSRATMTSPSPSKKQCTTRCSCDRDEAIVSTLMKDYFTNEHLAEIHSLKEQLTVERAANASALNQFQAERDENFALRRRMNRVFTANRIIVGTNQRLRTMNNTLNDLLHEIFTTDPAMARFYRERIRFPDIDYSDDDDTDIEDNLALEMIETMRELEE